MKKLVSVLLCLMLLCTTCAFAERAYTIENAQTATSGTGLFTYELPADYLIMTPEMIQQTIDTFTEIINEEDNELGVDAATAQNLISVLSNIDPTIADHVYTPDYIGNLNFQTGVGVGLTNDDLASASDTLGASFTEQYVQMGANEEDCISVGMVTIGNSETPWYSYNVTLLGVPMHQYLTCSENGDLVTATFANIDAEIEQAILESFTWIQ